MARQWKLICKVKDLPLQGARLVQRGLAWQELPGVALLRGADEQVLALLDSCPHQGAPRSWAAQAALRPCGARQGGAAARPQQGCSCEYTVLIEAGKVYLDLEELNAPASQAEAALAGGHGAGVRSMAFA